MQILSITMFALNEFTVLLFLDSHCESSRFLHGSVSGCLPHEVMLEKNSNWQIERDNLNACSTSLVHCILGSSVSCAGLTGSIGLFCIWFYQGHPPFFFGGSSFTGLGSGAAFFLPLPKKEESLLSKRFRFVHCLGNVDPGH